MSMRAWTVHLFRGRWDEEMCRVDAGSFRGVVRHAEAGDWELDAPVAGIGIPEHQVEQVGSVLVREGARTVFAGVVTPPTGKTLYSEGDGRRIKLGGTDVFGILQQRWVWPHPELEPELWEWKRHGQGGAACDVVARLIDLNAGRLARPERRMSIAVRTDGGGRTGKWSFDLERLDEAVGRVCREARIGCRGHVDADDLAVRFVVGERKRRDNLLITEDLEAKSFYRRRLPPTATYVVGLGERNEETDKRIVRTIDAGPVGDGRWEVLLDGNGDGPETMEAARAARDDGDRSWAVAVEVSTEFAQSLMFNRDYFVGDIIPMSIGGVHFPLGVESVSVTWSPQEQSTVPVLGESSPDALVELLRRVKRLERRLRRAVL